MRKTSWMVAAVAAVVIVTGMVAWGQGAPGERAKDRPWGGEMRGEMRGPMGPPDMQQELGLTDDQVAKMKALHFESAKTALKARTEVKLQRLELQQLLSAEEPNQVAIDKTLRALSDAQYAAMKSRVTQQLAMRQLLTPEQRKKMETMKHKFMRRGFMRRHNRHGFGGPGMRGPRGPIGENFEGPAIGPDGPGPMEFGMNGPDFGDQGLDFDFPVDGPDDPGL